MSQAASLLLAPYLASAALVAAAGVAKAVRPAETAKALAVAKIRLPLAAVRALAVAEALVGLGALAAPRGAWAWALAASYAGFATLVGLALRLRLPLATCGCFGEADTAPTAVHVVVTLAAAANAAALAAAGGAAGLFGLGSLALGGWWRIVAWAVSAAATSYLAYLCLGALGKLKWQARGNAS